MVGLVGLANPLTNSHSCHLHCLHLYPHLHAQPSLLAYVSGDTARQRRKTRSAKRGGATKKVAHIGDSYHCVCTVCGKSKTKNTGHTQYKGKWYCTASEESMVQWKEGILKEKSEGKK
jgi:hypothetical protein